MELDGGDDTGLPVPEFRVLHQDVELDVAFANASLSGLTEITVEPLTKELNTIYLNCRQISVKSVTVDGLSARVQYRDPYDILNVGRTMGVHQHHLIQGRLQDSLKDPPRGELVITLPRKVKVVELGGQDLKSADDGEVAYNTLNVVIHFTVTQSRDAIHWVGLEEDDLRYSHVYTRNQPLPGETSNFVFPCVDSLSCRSTWKIIIRCPRTLGDISKESSSHERDPVVNREGGLTNGFHTNGDVEMVNVKSTEDGSMCERSLAEDDKALELSVVCSGYMEENDAPGDHDPSWRKWIFTCNTPVAPQHIGFAIGPFEQVDLSDFRESDQDEKLGQNAVRVHGFCLPGRAEEVRYTAMPVAMALDYFTINYGSYPFEMETASYKMCFVDDLVEEITDTATLSICSTRLLVPPNVIDKVNDNIRELVRSVATQWLGINIVPKMPNDFWIVLGGSYFMADDFMQTLWGRNEHRYRQKKDAIELLKQDINRPSIYDLGPFAGLDKSNFEFLKLKVPLVFFILNSRLVKASGSKGVNRIFWRLLLDAKVGKIDNNEIDTERFLRICDRVGHAKLDNFFQQWVYGSGYPSFHVQAKFNKKKLVVETTILQMPKEHRFNRALQSDYFMRDIKEWEEEVRPGTVQNIFTGPMTIRIHEADGTPYEHIVDIKDAKTTVEIPYNTKYKRLKRTRRQRERLAAGQVSGATGDEEGDALLYCLGDVLQTPQEMADWRLVDWDQATESKMNDQSYEWMRVDKDFEWICELSYSNMPNFMWLSQLQQDNDVVAQVDSLYFLWRQREDPRMTSTILVRTLMDNRYFYRIRGAAADILSRLAVPELDWIGLFHLEKAFQELFCFPNSPMTRSNDFSDPRAYDVRCQIVKHIATIRDERGEAPESVKRFLLEKLKFNDNTNNQYSDANYVGILMKGLADSLVGRSKETTMSFDFDNEEAEIRALDFQKAAIEEIERHRRIDEWIPSWNNQLTVIALDCLEGLIKGKVAPLRLTDFTSYTRPENSDPVRLQAFSSLVELGSLTEPIIFRWVFYSLQTARSPYFRDQLARIIGRGLGQAAFRGPKQAPQHSTNGLVIEGGDTHARQQEIERTTTLSGAIKSLKAQLVEDPAFEQAILETLQSPLLSLNDFMELLTICRTIYTPVDRQLIIKKLPRYWQVKHEGQGVLHFTQTGPYRAKPAPKFDPKALKRPRPSVMSPSTGSDLPDAKRRRTSDSPSVKRAGRGMARSNSPMVSVASPLAESGRLSAATSPAPSTASHTIRLPVQHPSSRPSISRASTTDDVKSDKQSHVIKLKITNKSALADVESRTASSQSSVADMQASQTNSIPTTTSAVVNPESPDSMPLAARQPAAGSPTAPRQPNRQSSSGLKLKLNFGGASKSK